jgi:hypothetical protein
MQPQDMLGTLNEYGEEAGSDFNDGDDVMGWFSWSVTGEGRTRQLTITYTPGAGGAKQTATWVLVPVKSETSEPAGR